MSLPGSTPVPSLLPDYMRSLSILSNGINTNAQAVLNNIKIQPLSGGGGSGNIGIGINANKNTSDPSDHNIGIGTNTLQTASTGGVDFNNALGYESMQDLTSGINNNAIGSKTLTNMTAGSFNTAVGHESLSNITSGDYNIAIGANSYAF